MQPLTPTVFALLAVGGAAALLVGLAVLMRGAGAAGRRGVIAVLAVGGAGVFLSGTAFASPLPQRPTEQPPAAVPAPTASSTPPTTALAALDLLTVRDADTRRADSVAAGLDAWADDDGDGCDTRDDVLRRDLDDPVVRGCTVRRGVLEDPYTGDAIRFRRGSAAAAVRIDHVVSIDDAQRTGALRLTVPERAALANDPLNLLATSADAVAAKDGGDAASWLPVRAFRCAYVARQVAVKRTYDLWVTPAERAVMARVLDRCVDEPLPVGAS